MAPPKKLTDDEMGYLKEIGTPNLELGIGKVINARVYARLKYLEARCAVLEERFELIGDYVVATLRDKTPEP